MFTLSEGDRYFSLRWRLIKSGFSRALPKTESLSAVRQAAGERGIWQRHFWKHLIRDDLDFQRHIDSVHVSSAVFHITGAGKVLDVISFPHKSIP